MAYNSLSKELATHGAQCMLKTLVHLPQYMAQATTQDESQATKAPKIYKGDSLLYRFSLKFQHRNGKYRLEQLYS